MTNRTRRNKDIAGYQILLLIANADSDFDPKEGKVISDFIAENFPLGGNLEAALDEIANLKEDEYSIELQQLAEDFYADSTEKERFKFLKFVMDVILADQVVDRSEDLMLNKLYQYWDIPEA